jgi:hypothetical protein
MAESTTLHHASAALEKCCWEKTCHPRNVEVNEICDVSFQEQRTREDLESETHEVSESRTREDLESETLEASESQTRGGLES